MAQEIINIGAADAKAGDTLFSAFTKVNNNFDEVFASTVVTKRILVNSIADLPDEVLGVITLADNTLYVQANDLDFSTTRLVLGANTVWSGLDTIIATATYTGTLPFFSMLNTTNSIERVNILHPNADLLSYSDSGSNALRVVDVTCTGKALGNLGGTNSAVRFTNVSPILTSGGLAFTGNWSAFLFEPSFASISAGSLIDLGVATFDSVSITQINLNYTSGDFFLSGAVSSANINTGGSGAVILSRFSGSGTTLSGISVDDVLWEFHHNDDIQDTLRDSLIYSSSALTTTISVAETYVKVNATWAEDSASGFSSDSTGKITSNLERLVKVPVDVSLSVAPSTGTNKTIRARLAINGSTLTNSTITVNTDAGNAKPINIPWQVNISPSDYLEVFCTTADATDVICSAGIVRVN